jgi:phage FluMu gp28-like protein
MLLPNIKIPPPEKSRLFLPYQLHWIFDESPLLLAEKSVRIGWTFADAFKNVRKRLLHPRRDYLFSSKDQATAIEYVRTCYQFCELFNQTKCVLSHGIEDWKTPVFKDGRNTGFTEDFKVGYIKFDNRSRIISFSSNPHALRAYGGDVGLDEFAFHADAETLWASACGRITWGFNLAIWSSHNGSDSLFYTFCREAGLIPAAGRAEGSLSRAATEEIPSPRGEGQGEGGRSSAPVSNSPLRTPHSALGGWSHYRVTLTDAIECGLVEKINQVRGTGITRAQFLQNCKDRARVPEVFEQEYMCNPMGGTKGIVDWSAIDRCRHDYEIDRLHLEEHEILEVFGEFRPEHQFARERQIESFIGQAFQQLFGSTDRHRLGFDVAASGRGSLTVIYVDRLLGSAGGPVELAGLFTCRTQDWHFIKTVLYTFMQRLNSVEACGDETGLGRQICWEASRRFAGSFFRVNFSSEKHDMGFILMNQLAVGEKRFPRSEQDIASDFFALRKHYTGSRWLFTEAQNPLNPNSHCDIAWAGALASKANRAYSNAGAAVA